MSARRVLRAALVAAAGAAMLALAPSALAAPGDTFTWSGQSPASPLNWSDAANWTVPIGQTDTTPSGTVSSLTFPALNCAATPDPCTGYDNVTPLTAGQLTIDTSTNYRQYPSGSVGSAGLTLTGNGSSPNVGLTTTYGNTVTAGNSPTAVFDFPIFLTGAAQTWDIPNGNLYVAEIGDAAGQSTPLTVSLGGSVGAYGFLQAGTITTAGAVTVQGTGDLGVPSDSGLANPMLPAVTLTGATYLTVSTSTTSKAIDASADTGDVQVFGVPGSTLDISSGNLTLGAHNGLDLDVDGNSAGLATSVDVTNGSAALGGATLYIDQNYEAAPNTACTTLTPGTTVTLLSASGGITGSVVVNGHTITRGQSATEPMLNACGGPSATAIVNYNANTLTATIAGPPAAVAGQGPQISGRAGVGDTLTVTNNGSWTGAPAPTYSYKWLACSGSSCSLIGGATGKSYVLANAQVGKTVKVQVTASNSYGSASAFSNSAGPVTGHSVTTTPSLRALIRADLRRLPYPHGRRALRLLRHRGYYRTHFHAPIAGTLSVTWRTTVKTGHGRHARRHSYVLARGVAHTRRARSLPITIRLTRVGRRLLRQHPFSLRVRASDRFLARGYGWTSFTRRFRL